MKCGIAGLLLLAALGMSAAQQAPSFEVASIKPQPWTGQGGVYVIVRGNMLSAEHSSLYDLVEFAYGLRDEQLSGGPAWATRGVLAASDLYQVVAKPAEGPLPTQDEFRLMLQALLAERFQLKVHHAEKNLSVFNLVVAKDGPKLRPSAPDAKFSMRVDGTVEGGKMTRMTVTHGSIAQLMAHTDHYTGRPWLDRTNLSGLYDFELEWAPDSLSAANADGEVTDPLGVSLFTALQKQLGLKLEPGTAPFDAVVIDHAEKPSGN